MTPIQQLLAKLTELGCPEPQAMELIMAVVQCGKVDAAAEKRRAWDREYRRKRKLSGGIPPERNSTRKQENSTRIPPETNNALYIDNTTTVINELEKKYKSKQQSRTRGTRLPPDWQPSHEDIQFAVACGIPQNMVISEASGFRDYWIGVPGTKGCKLDWPATWRNWCRRIGGSKYRQDNITPFPAKPLTHRQKILKHNMEIEDALATGNFPDLRATAGAAGSQAQILPALAGPAYENLSETGKTIDARTSYSNDSGDGELF